MSPASVTQTSIRQSGVWSSVESFLDEVKSDSEVIWVTYSLSPGPEHLRAFEERGLRLSIVCQHPLEGSLRGHTYGGPSIDPRVYRLLSNSGLIDCLVGYRADACTQDETVQFGPLHAKWLVAKSGSKYWLAYGSFNFTRGSLGDNCETFWVSSNPKEAETVWLVTQHLLESSEAIEEKHCHRTMSPVGRPEAIQPTTTPPRRFSEIAPIEGGPKEAGHRVSPRHRHSGPQIDRPQALREFAAILEERMRGWPSEGLDRQWQIYLDLENELPGLQDPWQLLYLPVGVGKTYIALHWLAARFAGLRRQDLGQSWLLFATPNEWIKRSVDSAIANVESACSHGLPSDLLLPAQPARAWDLLDTRGPPIAAIVDECHNWSDGNHKGSRSYSALVDRLVDEGTPLLGLSATPCRFEHSKFAPTAFIKRWLDRDPGDTAKPYMTLRDAVDKGFLCKFKYDLSIAQSAREAVKTRLTTGSDEELIAFGEYSQTTLRSIWDEIASNPDLLARDIVAAIRRHRSRRIVVFLPPVDEDAEPFVDCLRDVIERIGGRLFDFRARAAGGPVRTFDEFQEFPAKTANPAVLATIDRFREGVNVPDIDMLVMLRATLSPLVAMQALGRGLRHADGKKQCVVLDAVLFQERVEMWEQHLETVPEVQSSDFEQTTLDFAASASAQEHSTATPMETLPHRELFYRWLIRRLRNKDMKKDIADFLGLSTDGKSSELTERLVEIPEADPGAVVSRRSPIEFEYWNATLEGCDRGRRSNYDDLRRDLWWCCVLDHVGVPKLQRVGELRDRPEAQARIAETLGKSARDLTKALSRYRANKNLLAAMVETRLLRAAPD